jgi:hypothetical protein
MTNERQMVLAATGLSGASSGNGRSDRIEKRTSAKTIFEEDEVITVTSYASAGIDQPAPKMHINVSPPLHVPNLH